MGLWKFTQQVIEYDSVTSGSIDSGWVLVFHPDLIRSYPLHKKMKDYGFFSYQSNEALHLSEKENETLYSILEKIEIELDSNLDDFSEEVIVTNIELLLNYSKRFYNRQFITRKNYNKNVINTTFPHCLRLGIDRYRMLVLFWYRER